MITKKEVNIKHSSIHNMIANPFTKLVAKDFFNRHIKSLSLCLIYLYYVFSLTYSCKLHY